MGISKCFALTCSDSECFFSLAQSQEIKLKTEETHNCPASVPQHSCHINPLATGRVSAVALHLGFSRAPILAVLCKDSAGQKTSRSCELHWASPSKFSVKGLLELAFPFFLCMVCSFKVFLFSFCICEKLYQELQLSEYSGGTMQISIG